MVQQSPELVAFYRFVGERMANGGESQSPEEVLDDWRNLHPDSNAIEEDIAAVQEAIDDLERGEIGIPFDEFDRDFRVRRDLPPSI